MNAISKVEVQPTKTLADVKRDMSTLYEQTRNGTVDIKLASELTNITGKYLKADALEFAREVFLDNQSRRIVAQ